MVKELYGLYEWFKMALEPDGILYNKDYAFVLIILQPPATSLFTLWYATTY